MHACAQERDKGLELGLEGKERVTERDLHMARRAAKLQTAKGPIHVRRDGHDRVGTAAVLEMDDIARRRAGIADAQKTRTKDRINALQRMNAIGLPALRRRDGRKPQLPEFVSREPVGQELLGIAHRAR